MNTADEKRLADELLIGKEQSFALPQQLPASITTEQLNHIIMQYMNETNKQLQMQTTNSSPFSYPALPINSTATSPSTSASIQNQSFGSLLGEDALKLMLLNQANRSPMNIQQHTSPNGNNYHHQQQQSVVKSEHQQLNNPRIDNIFEMVRHQLEPPRGPLSVEKMMTYLRNPNEYECVIQIFHARVAQKSYGNEKRFFCPPPCVYLTGGGWSRKRLQFREALKNAYPHLNQLKPEANRIAELQRADPRVHIGIQALRDDLNGRENQKENSDGLVQWTNEPQELDFSDGKDYCAAKTLFISDSEKTKFFKLFVQISFMGGQEIGTFLSERIKVISKPSKKKQSMKNNECSYLCITSGKKIALFHRLRSQTVSTKYLHVEGGSFRASSTRWGAFTIHLVDEVKSPTDTHDFHTKDGYIYYGAVVKLVDTNSGISLPRLRIRKADKSNIITEVLSFDEPVSQLHKCAFQFVDDPSLYLSLVSDQIAQHRADIINVNQHQVVDGAVWSIISTEKVEYRYYEALGPVLDPVTPAPIVDNITFDSDKSSITSYGTVHTMSMRGRNFHPDLKVWFATHQCTTTYRSAEILDCDIPKLEHLIRNKEVLDVCGVSGDRVEVPIFLVREDGVIYSTCLTFTYDMGIKC